MPNAIIMCWLCRQLSHQLMAFHMPSMAQEMIIAARIVDSVPQSALLAPPRRYTESTS
jgi:hypothetical protein